MNPVVLNLDPPYVLIKPGVSEDEFYAWADEDTDAELLDGRIVVHSPASDRHEDVFRFLLTLVSAFVDARCLGSVRGSRFPMRLDDRWSPEPDLMFVRADQTHRIGTTRLEGPAEWIVEILSPATRDTDLKDKRPRYRESHIPELWFLDPETGIVIVDWLEGERYESRTVTPGRLESRTMPGFWIHTGWITKRPMPSTIECLRLILPEEFGSVRPPGS